MNTAATIRVRYCECDPMGYAHHSAYGPWLEIARTELLRATGVSYAELESRGVLLVVTKMELNFRRPAKYDDVVAVHARVERVSHVKIVHAYDVRLLERAGVSAEAIRGRGEDLLVTASTTIACIGRDGRPRALPDEMKE